MSQIGNAVFTLRKLEETASGRSFIHRLNPAAKLVTTIIFIIVVLSFGKYEISGLIPFILYPVIIAAMADVPAKIVFTAILPVIPAVILLGAFNIFYDKTPFFQINDLIVTGGMVSLISMLFRCILTVEAGILLVCTTGIRGIGRALASMGIPEIMVIQIMMTYRYIILLLEEAERIINAYTLRAPESRGIDFRHYGSLPGHLLIRSFERAGRIYNAMQLRGFGSGSIMTEKNRWNTNDFLYLCVWILYFASARIYNLPEILEKITVGL